MGLDMYVRASKYVSGYQFRDDEERAEYKTLVEMFGVQKFVDPETPSGSVEFVVAYWRKANHIHQWFVDNCQDGRDECQKAYVSREQLRQLRETCLRVLALPTEDSEIEYSMIADGGFHAVREMKPALTTAAAEEAEELLPTRSGFFFGGTEYNHWYREDCEQTVKQIDRILVMPDEWEFEYQSSW